MPVLGLRGRHPLAGEGVRPGHRDDGVPGRGDAVFAAADGRSIFVERQHLDCPASAAARCDPNAEQVVQIPLEPGGSRHVFAVPTGWYVNAGDGFSNPISVVGGILVQSARPGVSATPARFGLWDPATGHIRPLGRDWGLIDAHTAAGGHSSLLAWLPSFCADGRGCGVLEIADTGSGRTITVHSPLPYGFDIGGAFSPDGSRLAVFVKTNSGTVNPAMQLALVDTRTGSLRLIPGVQGEIGESVGWARWLPGGTSVLAGTFSSNYRTYNHYLVDVRSGAVKVVDFSSNPNLDVNFSSSTIGGLAPRPDSARCRRGGRGGHLGVAQHHDGRPRDEEAVPAGQRARDARRRRRAGERRQGDRHAVAERRRVQAAVGEARDPVHSVSVPSVPSVTDFGGER